MLRVVSQTQHFAMASCSEVLEFEDEGFSSVIISETEETVYFRINLKSGEEFQRWKEHYMQKNNTCFNVKRAYPRSQWKLFHKTFICLHGDVRNNGKKKTCTGYVLYFMWFVPL